MRTNVRAPLKNPAHRSSRRKEAQTSSPQPPTLNPQPKSQSLVTSAATIAFAVALLLAGVGSVLASVRYVDVNSTNATPPYTNWTTAATNIQDAVDAAVAGDEIVVTNGVYATGGRSTIDQSTTTNRVVVDKPVTLRSVNGPQSTIIDGCGVVRCVYLTN